MSKSEAMECSDVRLLYSITSEQVQEFAMDNWGVTLNDEQLESLEITLWERDTSFIGDCLHCVLDN